jgi:peptidoglycan/xylan/chitin deacetylase (PgdA/CDA1 family)
MNNERRLTGKKVKGGPSPFGTVIIVMLAAFLVTALAVGALLNLGSGSETDETTGSDTASPESSGSHQEIPPVTDEATTASSESTREPETTVSPETTTPETTLPETTLPETEPTIDPNRKLVAFTFDDGPNAKYTEEVLAVLEKYDAHATFFVVGVHSTFTRAGEVMKKVVEAGHEIGNHTYNHISLPKLTAAEIKQDEQQMSDRIFELCGVRPTLMRAPGGSYNSDVLAAVSYPLIGWTVDTLDWKHQDPEQALEYLKAQVSDGGIILMHDRLETSAETAELLLQWLYENDYQVVSVSELMEARGVTMEAGKVYYSDKLIRPNN